MAKRRKPPIDLIVKAEDCYDPADYVMVHKDYWDRLVYALQRIAADDGTENCYSGVAAAALGKHRLPVSASEKQ